MSNRLSSEHLARIEPVDPARTGRHRAGAALSLPWKLLLNTVLLLIPAATILIELLLVWIGFRMPSPASYLVVVSGLAVAIATNIGWIGSFPEWPMNRLLTHRLRRIVLARHRSGDDLSAGDSLPEDREWLRVARMVEWVPRENWCATKLDTAEDVMLMRLGADGLELEGDSSRYHFPPGSILDAHLESLRPSGCFHRLHYVVVTVRTVDGPMEFPLAYRDHQLGRLRSVHRQRAAAELCDAIASVATGTEYSHGLREQGAVFVDPGRGEVPSPIAIDRNPYASPRIV